MNKWFSRKLLMALVGVVYTIVELQDGQMPVDQVAVVDGLVAIYLFVQGMIDLVQAKRS